MHNQQQNQTLRLYHPLFEVAHSDKTREGEEASTSNKNKITAITDFVVSCDDHNSDRGGPSWYLLTASDLEAESNIKQWIRRGMDFVCVETFRVDGELNVCMMSQVTEDVFVGLCLEKRGHERVLKFWNIKEPTGSIRCIERVTCAAALKHTKNTVAIGLYDNSKILLQSMDGDESIIKTHYSNEHVMSLCETEEGFLVSMNQSMELKWWNIETKQCVRFYEEVAIPYPFTRFNYVTTGSPGFDMFSWQLPAVMVDSTNIRLFLRCY